MNIKLLSIVRMVATKRVSSQGSKLYDPHMSVLKVYLSTLFSFPRKKLLVHYQLP